jgi:hypothetical protein
VVCKEVALAMKALDLKPGTRAFSIAAQTIRTINKWDPRELDEHLEWASGMQTHILEEKWQVEL